MGVFNIKALFSMVVNIHCSHPFSAGCPENMGIQ